MGFFKKLHFILNILILLGFIHPYHKYLNVIKNELDYWLIIIIVKMRLYHFIMPASLLNTTPLVHGIQLISPIDNKYWYNNNQFLFSLLCLSQFSHLRFLIACISKYSIKIFNCSIINMSRIDMKGTDIYTY